MQAIPSSGCVEGLAVHRTSSPGPWAKASPNAADCPRVRLRNLIPVGLGILPGVLGVSAAQAAPSVAEFPVGARPGAVAAGSDGNVWFTDTSDDDGIIGRITPNGAVTRFQHVLGDDDGSAAITAGPGGMWFVESEHDRVGRITNEGAVKAFGTGGHHDPTSIAAGPDGNLWYTAKGDGGAIVRITPAGAVTEFTAGLTPGGKPQDITAGPDGNLWFTAPGTGRIGRVTPAGAITEFGAGSLVGSPRDITAGPDGNVWFTENGSAPAVARVTPDGVIAQYTVGLPLGSAPESIATGADGNVHFTDRGANAIGHVTPAGAITTSGGLAGAAGLRGITTGPDGRLWFAEQNGARMGRMTVAPSVGRTVESAVGATEATLGSSVNPNAQATTSHFEWGTSTGYGSSSPAVPAGVGAVVLPASARVTGLSASTTYHARLVAANDSGTTTGPDRTFRTAAPGQRLADPADGDAANAGAAPAPAADPTKDPVLRPVLGKTAVASAPRGIIRYRAPGGVAVEVDGSAAIPTGSVVDTSAGTVALESAVDATGKTQKAKFNGAKFRMKLSKRDVGMVDVYLTHGRVPCPESSEVTGRAARVVVKPSRLWSKDRNGRYRTHGRNSVALVRGTEWTTTDSCDGTLTRVSKGTVAVTDNHTHKTVLVSAGRQYLARPAS